jgi:hypothetical protein
MGTERERLRRWREKNKAKGKKSFTVMLSIEAQYILKRERERAGGATYSSIIEGALSGLKASPLKTPVAGKPIVTSNEIGVASNVASNDMKTGTKLLIDDEMSLKEFEMRDEHRVGRIVEDRDGLKMGLIPRLLKKSKSRFYRLKK